VRRVVVIGNSGSGKTRLAAGLSRRLGVPHVELDAIYHQSGWVPLPEEQMRARVAEAVAGRRWVVDGNYSVVRDLVWDRADTIIWLDLPRWVVARQVVWRTLRRAALRRQLWNGNRERWRNFFSLDPMESVIVWSWRKHGSYREQYARAMRDPRWVGLHWVRLQSRRAAHRLLNGQPVTEHPVPQLPAGRRRTG
jgi:adenylate kinase family enzyme